LAQWIPMSAAHICISGNTIIDVWIPKRQIPFFQTLA
jgi:hypothetical protein